MWPRVQSAFARSLLVMAAVALCIAVWFVVAALLDPLGQSWRMVRGWGCAWLAVWLYLVYGYLLGQPLPGRGGFIRRETAPVSYHLAHVMAAAIFGFVAWIGLTR